MSLPNLSDHLHKTKHKRAKKSLPTLGQKQKPPEMAKPQQQVRRADVIDDTLQELANALQDEQLAKRVLKLKEEYVHATIPELVCIDWFERRAIKWAFQVWALGGRRNKGGQVLDLIVDGGTGVVVVEVQGNYWHNRPGQQQEDAAQKITLMGLKIWGKPVRAVVEVWESRIMSKSKRDRTMEMALVGVEAGP